MEYQNNQNTYWPNCVEMHFGPGVQLTKENVIQYLIKQEEQFETSQQIRFNFNNQNAINYSIDKYFDLENPVENQIKQYFQITKKLLDQNRNEWYPIQVFQIINGETFKAKTFKSIVMSQLENSLFQIQEIINLTTSEINYDDLSNREWKFEEENKKK